MTDRFHTRLSEYLDGQLEPEEVTLMERHLAECQNCRATLDDLQAVVTRARALEPKLPPEDLWPGIAAAIATPALAEEKPLRLRLRERRFTLSIPQLAAAAVALIGLSAGSAWLVGSSGHSGSPLAADAPPSAAAFTAADPGTEGTSGYGKAIEDLQTALFHGEGALDSVTVAKLKHSLLTIDRAIADAQRVLQEDAADPYVRQHLAEAQRKKVRFLRQAVSLQVART
jgi:hypothetical protein